MADKEKSAAELQQEQRDKERYGDDPNAIDRMKNFGLHEKDGKFFQQIGDEFFQVEQPKTKDNK